MKLTDRVLFMMTELTELLKLLKLSVDRAVDKTADKTVYETVMIDRAVMKLESV